MPQYGTPMGPESRAQWHHKRPVATPQGATAAVNPGTTDPARLAPPRGDWAAQAPAPLDLGVYRATAPGRCLRARPMPADACACR
jgi:hypothetical protein